MSVIFLLIPLSILLSVSFLAAFIWAVRSGQYEDTCTPSMRVLLEEAAPPGRNADSQCVDALPVENLRDGSLQSCATGMRADEALRASTNQSFRTSAASHEPAERTTKTTGDTIPT